jgi:hypothetical protein
MVRPVNPAEPPRSGELAALAAAPVNDAAFKSAAAAALLSSLRAASPLTLQRSRSAKAVGPTRQAATTTLNAFHFRQVLFIRCSPRQTCGGRAQHSRAPSPQTSERRTSSAARAAPALDEQRPSSLTQPIPISFSLCF